MFKGGAAQAAGEADAQPHVSHLAGDGGALNCREAPRQQGPKAGEKGGEQAHSTSLFEKSLWKFERLQSTN